MPVKDKKNVKPKSNLEAALTGEAKPLNSTAKKKTTTKKAATNTKPVVSKAKAPKLKKAVGKRSDPNYIQVSFFIKKDLHKAAKLEALHDDSDLSDILEEVLEARYK